MTREHIPGTAGKGEESCAPRAANKVFGEEKKPAQVGWDQDMAAKDRLVPQLFIMQDLALYPSLTSVSFLEIPLSL